MTRTKTLLSALTLAAVTTLAATADARKAPAAPRQGAAATYADIQRTFGFVPTFLRALPDVAIGPFWAQFKGLALNPNTRLGGKEKELIGLAVAAQIPCGYCVYAHTAAARAQGATEDEIKEAIALAALTRYASTVLNGTQIDEATYRKEIDKILANARKAARK